MDQEIEEMYYDDAEHGLSVFLLEELGEKVSKMNEDVITLVTNLQKKHEKMMEGFRCIEKSFRLLARAMESFSEDLGSATGTLSTDPWAFDA